MFLGSYLVAAYYNYNGCRPLCGVGASCYISAMIADSGHATPIDQAEAFDRVVEEFLESAPAPGAADLRVGAK